MIAHAMQYDYEKLEGLNKERSRKYREMWIERDYYKKRKLQLEVKILDLKIAIEKMKQYKLRQGRSS